MRHSLQVNNGQCYNFVLFKLARAWRAPFGRDRLRKRLRSACVLTQKRLTVELMTCLTSTLALNHENENNVQGLQTWCIDSFYSSHHRKWHVCHTEGYLSCGRYHNGRNGNLIASEMLPLTNVDNTGALEPILVKIYQPNQTHQEIQTRVMLI